MGAARHPALRAAGLAVAVAAVAAAVGGLAFVHVLEQRVVEALGPRTLVEAIHYRYPTLVLENVRITSEGAPYDWPAPEEGHADRLELTASLASLWAARDGGELHVREVAMRGGSLTLLRTPGHLVLLPALREQARERAEARTPAPPAPSESAASATPAAPAPGRGLLIDRVHFENVDVEVHDATLKTPRPFRLRLTEGHGDIEHLALPALAQPMQIDLGARVPGHDGADGGTLAVQGSVTPALRDAALSVRLAQADLVELQPYLLRFGEGGLTRGRIDLQLDARVVRGALRAPGRLTLTGLQFGDAGGTFAGVERRAVLAALSRNGRLDTRFTLEGRLDDPKFTLNESLGGRIAVGLTDAVGVSVKGAVQSVGDALKGLLGGGSPPGRP